MVVVLRSVVDRSYVDCRGSVWTLTMEELKGGAHSLWAKMKPTKDALRELQVDHFVLYRNKKDEVRFGALFRNGEAISESDSMWNTLQAALAALKPLTLDEWKQFPCASGEEEIEV